MKCGWLALFLLVGCASSHGLFKHNPTQAEMERSLARLPMDGAYGKKATLHSELGMLFYNEGKAKEGAAEFEKALLANPSRSLKKQAFRYLAKCYESLDRLDKAIPAYEQATLYDPKYWRAHRDLAMAYEKAELYDKALASYQQALKLNPRVSTLWLLIGQTYRKMGLLREAEDYLKKARTLGNASEILFMELSLTYEGRGRFKEAAQTALLFVHPSSSASDWGRVIYLAVLAGDGALAQEALNQLKAGNSSPFTQTFYTDLVELSHQDLAGMMGPKWAKTQFRTLVDTLIQSEQ